MSANGRLHATTRSNRAPAACARLVGAAPATETETLRIVVADADPSALALYRAALIRRGHEVRVARTGPELVEACRLLNPDAIVFDVELAESDGLAATGVFDGGCAAVVLVDADFDPQQVTPLLEQDWVSAWLTRPVPEAALAAALAVAARKSLQVRALRVQVAELQQALEDRKLVERAKGAVMKRLGVSEAEAYRRMRGVASTTNQKLVEVSRRVLVAETTFSELDTGARDPQTNGAGPVPSRT